MSRIVRCGTALGFPFEVRAVDHPYLGHYLCGYVAVPDGHPAYGKNYDDWILLDISVHGGLTYASIRTPCSDETQNQWWLGFDCNHAGDIPTGVEPEMTPWGELEHCWTEVQVLSEIESLAYQLQGMWR